MKFILLHDSKNEEGIRAFFIDVWELYLKVRFHTPSYSAVQTPTQTMMNPFHTAHSPIRSSVFDARVRASAKKYL